MSVNTLLPFENLAVDSQEQLLLEYRAIFDNAAVGIACTLDRKFFRCNARMEEMFDYAPGELNGLPAIAIFPNDESYRLIGAAAGPLLAAGKPFEADWELKRKDGGLVWVHAFGKAVDLKLNERGTVWIMEDITAARAAQDLLQKQYAELKVTHRQLEDAQAQLLQAEKMSSIGQLAAGVAHEINNPIGFVYSNIGSLGDYVKQLLELIDVYERINAEVMLPAAAVREIAAARQTMEIDFLRKDVADLLDETREGVQRVRRIVQDLRDFSRSDEGSWQLADINAGIRSTLNVVWNEVKYKAKVELDLGELPPVCCNLAQVNQVVMNLLVNAAQAIEQSGQITVRSRAEGDGVWLEVEDNGCGVPAELQARIFDPFFTTKPVGKGTGLGLAVSYGIVGKHGGRIEVDSTRGQGARFRVWLPIAGPGVADDLLPGVALAS